MKRSRESEEISDKAVALAGRDIGDKIGDGHGELQQKNEDNETSAPAAKIAGLDLSSNASNGNVKVHCSLPPHREPEIFSSYSAYEAHYRDQHSNRCVQCRKNFPSAHLLSLHIEETHDSFAQVRREKGERTYSCFVEGCDRKCSTPQKRKMHLIDKHMYPKNFFFAITREGIDGRCSLLLETRGRHRRSGTAEAPPHLQPTQVQKKAQAHGQAERLDGAGELAAAADDRQAAEPGRQSPEHPLDENMEDLTSAMSSLKFVPMSVRFGRGKRAGFAKR